MEAANERIYQLTGMADRFRVNPNRKSELSLRKPEQLIKALEMRRMNTDQTMASSSELGKRVSQDVNSFLEGRMYSLQSALARRQRSASALTSQATFAFIQPE